MYKIDFSHPGKAHFIGIGGISMSGFAELLHTMGFTITGSDRTASKITKHLETLGIEVLYEQAAKNRTSTLSFTRQRFPKTIRNLSAQKNSVFR